MKELLNLLKKKDQMPTTMVTAGHIWEEKSSCQPTLRRAALESVIQEM